MISNAILIVYLIGYVYRWRWQVWALLHEVSMGDIVGFDVVMSLIIGSIANLLWPVIWLSLGIGALYRRHEGSAVAALMPRSVRRERELAERKRRIAKLEQELSIK